MRVVILMAGLALAGCATSSPVALRAGEPWAVPQDVFQATGYTEDRHAMTGRFTGPRQRFTGADGSHLIWFMRSFESLETGAVTHQIYITVEYQGDWRFYRSAAAYGAGMPVREIRREVESCRVDPCRLIEHIAIDFPDELMSGLREHGMEFAIYSSRTSHEIRIPADYVDGYMRRVRGV